MSVNDRIIQPAYRIKINGAYMETWMYKCCTKVAFKETDADGANELLEIYFDDPELQIMESGKFKEKETVIICEMGYVSDCKTLFMGVVQIVENDYPQSGRITLKITAKDITYCMNEGEVTKSWKGLTYSDIVKQICTKYGISVITDDTIAILPRMTGSDKVETVTEAPKAESYTVVKGDTLWKIAKKYYSNGGKYTTIFNANRNVIKSPNLIYPGQSLTIPDVNANATTSSKTVAKAEPTVVNQTGVTDLKFMQNMANQSKRKLMFVSKDRLCYFVRPENVPLGTTVNGDYKSGDCKIQSFKPKFNDYDKAMNVVASNYNIDSNKVVSTLTIAEDSVAKSSAVTPKAKTYTVKSGDSLWKISKAMYGSGGKYATIFNANKSVIKNANLIYPGQVITIP